MKNIFLLIIAFLGLICISHSRRVCNHRSYGSSATVCVCNTTYCDDLSPFTKTDNGVITLYESSIKGHRFEETVFKFGTNNNNSTKSQTVSIDRNKKYQKIIGFGGAFTDSAGINIASLPKQLQTNILEDYFSEKGIEYTVGRIPIGGCDFSTRPYSYCDYPNDDNLTHFSLTEDDLVYKIPYIKLAQKLSSHKLKLFGSPWSPPSWMKTTQTFHKGGVLIGEPGGKYYQIWANYLVKFLDEYKQQNVSLWGLTVENEPDNGFKHLGKDNRFNDLGFTPTAQRDFVKLNLGPTLEKAGYGPKNLELIIFDGEKRADVYKWSDTVFGDKEAEKYVSGIAFHWYENKEENIETLDKTHDLYPNKFLLSTESCTSENKTQVLGNWLSFEKYAYDIITDLNHWTTGWVDWNLVLDVKTGGPNWAFNDPDIMVNAPILVNKSANEYYKQPIFYSMAHFSKFLIPDSVRIHINSISKADKFETTAFLRPDNAIVLIALNLNEESIQLVVEDSLYGKFTRLVTPHSLQTYLWF